jgi:hypothetical protein
LAAKKHKEFGPVAALIPTFISGVLGATTSASNHREQEYTKAANETLSYEEF